MRVITAISLALTGIASATPYSQYILTPSTRTLTPRSIYNVNGTVEGASSLTTSAVGTATFHGHSAVTFDFGKNIAGIVSFNVSSVSGPSEFIGVSFTESSLWINSDGCDATADSGIDEALWFQISAKGPYVAPKYHQRGAFRYLNIYHNTTGSVELSGLSVYFTALPQLQDSQLQSYSGFFHCEDDQLNRIWYAGAYTNQLCTIEPNAGDALVQLFKVNSTEPGNSVKPLPWYLNGTVAKGASVLVDGAKRDRLVWPGDASIAVPSMFVSTNDMKTVQNALDSLFVLQNSNGQLPYVGYVGSPKAGSVIPVFSFTYHLYSLIGLYNVYMFTGDLDYLSSHWSQFKHALNYSLSTIDASGMANVTSSADWLRFGMGGHNIEANAILYHTVNLGIYISTVMNETSVATQYMKYAAGIKSAANIRLWDPQANLYRDNDTHPLTKLHPQDGNSWAVISNLTDSAAKAKNISTALSQRWGPYGAPAPEAGPTVSPFISGFELQTHFLAGQPQLAVQLMKSMWGDFMLDDPRMTNSTFVEGYSTNGQLHYAPYTNDPRISHAHGWATGPTSALTFYVAGLRITAPAGKTWIIEPQMGNLTSAEAGFHTSLGAFAVNVTAATGGEMEVQFETPIGTSGTVVVAGSGPSSSKQFTVANGGRGRASSRLGLRME